MPFMERAASPLRILGLANQTVWCAVYRLLQDADDDDDEPITDAIGATKGLAVDNGDDALLLLKALAAQDPAVRDKLKGQSEILGTRCTLM